MIIGIGIDLIELPRVSDQLAQSNKLVKRILTRSEQKVFTKLRTTRRQVEFLAGRFAAKEAFAKAVGTGIGQLSFQDIEVLPNEHGAPVLTAKGYDEHRLFVSITHTEHYAAAQVVIEAT